MIIEGNVATVTGKVAYYPEDVSIGRAAGCRVGFAIYPPESVTDQQLENAWCSQDGEDPKKFSEVPGLSGDIRKFYWYPLVTQPTMQKTMVVDWDGDSEHPAETFTVIFDNVELEEVGK